jgi:Transcription factor WhiB/TraM recognition site of TraD and TraG
LDEAGNCAALSELDVLATTARGQGIQLVTVWHDKSQLEARYGAKASTILNNHRAKLFLSDLADLSALELGSRLIGGERQQVEHSRSLGSDGRQSLNESPLYRPLLPVEDLRHLRPVPVRLRPFYHPSERRRRRRLEDRAERQLRHGEQRRERATMRARQRAEQERGERERTAQPSLTQRLNAWLAGGRAGEGRLGWMDQAACKGLPTERFFPETGEGRKATEAKAICAGCHVQEPCRELAVRGADSLDTDHGVFGGTVPTERSHLRPNRFPESSAYRQERAVAERAHELASRVGLRQAAQELGVSRDTLKHWNLPQPERKPTYPPSRFLADRGEAERAFRLAEALGSINAAAGELGTTWPSLRKAFQRHQLGMPAPKPAAVNQRKSTVQLARRGTRRPVAPELDPAFARLNPGAVPPARGHTGTPAVRLRRAEEIEALGFGVVADMNRESRPSVRHRTVTIRAEHARQMSAERASRPVRRQAERAGRHEQARTERAERPARPHHPVSYRDER